MTELQQSCGDEDLAYGEFHPVPSTCKVQRIIVWSLLIAISLGGCSGKKRDFASEPVTTSTPSEGPGAADVQSAGGEPEQAQTCEGDCETLLGNDGMPSEGGGAFPLAGEAVFLLASVGQPCSPGATACDNDEQRLACENGVFAAVEQCTSVCREVDGVAGCLGACTPGDRGCSNTGAPEVCDAEGVWRPDVPCPVEAPVCQSGECVACEPGSTRCNPEGVPETCDAAGVWIAGAVCAGDTPLCVPELGECGQCSPGNGRACVEEQGNCAQGVQVCQADGTWGACSIQPAGADSCEPGDDATCDGTPNQGCACTGPVPCGPEPIGICQRGTAGCVNGQQQACVGAVGALQRDCSSTADNDCNGTPDNQEPECECPAGATRACDTHPQDGIGICRAGSQSCFASAGNSSTSWGPCQNSVGPSRRNCASAADNDCNGTADNREGACQCQDGATRSCGACGIGVERCVVSPDGSSSAFGACSGDPGPRPRNCLSTADNNCNGTPDNQEPQCECAIGTTRACDTHPQDGIGICRAGSQACVGTAGNTQSVWGQCQNSVGPAAETCDGRDNDCDRSVDDGFDLQNDASNCGQCGNRCATGFCQGGVCGEPPECVGSGVLGCPEFGGIAELICNGGRIEQRGCPIGEGCGINDPGCTPQICPSRSLFACNATGTARLFCADNGRDISESPCPADRPFCDSTVRELAPGSPVACQPCFTDADCLARGDGTTTCNPPNTAASSTLRLNTCDP